MTQAVRIGETARMSGSAFTAPKGRATRSRNDAAGGRRFITPKLQWALVILAAALALGAFFYLGSDVRSDYNGVGPVDSPAIFDSGAASR